MHSLRRLSLNHCRLAGLLIVLALAMKVLVPAGYMPAAIDGRIVLSVCTGAGPVQMAMPVAARDTAMVMPGMAHGTAMPDGSGHGDGGGGHDGKPEAPCAFSGLSAPGLAAADPTLLAAAILFVMALGLRAAAPPHAAAAHRLRPPLRGPPALT